jgi:flagellar M-ring protein FliF
VFGVENMEKILETIRRLGTTRVALTLTFSGMLLIVLIFLFTKLSNSSMVLLYSNLDPKEAGEIITKLEGQGISYELRGDGSQILVSSSQAPRLRMLFAQEGLPSGSGIGYEIFDKGDSLSTTAFTQDINYIRALEGELVKSITSINSVAAARVHLVIPKREPFQREQKIPTASVVIKIKGNGTLSTQSIQAIQQLVSAAVPGLDPSRVAVIDNTGRLLAKSQDDNDTQNINNNINDHRILLEEKLSHTIESLVERTVGYGKVRAQVSVDLDLDRITESSELYDPNSQVIRSTQVISDVNQEVSTENQPITVKNTVPSPRGRSGEQSGQVAQNKSNRNQEIINYEISKTVRQYVKESGDIKRLSIAVMVDGIYDASAPSSQYQARSTEELENIKTLVKSAIGFQSTRGDEIQVISMPFAHETAEVASTYDWLFGLNKNDLFRFIEILAFIGIGLLLTLNVIKPFFKNFMVVFNSIKPLISKPILDEEQIEDTQKRQPPQAIQLKNVSGLVQSDTVDTIHSLLEDYPQQAAKVVNSWLNER